ncbi:MAG: hypothetical protein UY48_C0006G0058 [Candidatus Gottesmanbacteria bacterium GW2011_GWB1_49_7]|uniref:Uncharacterized protein n=1 Tax=Candidatus Gottesmanbacteria bacterium GW2011_GWB1_49_7 TaxID=1618448 RepID=A0A0G1W333_9BACT|nr:MAG: hypothetical protein UY48_C0006G0058 [Candidatus Gottesmanbacteria bacterium GW2011_GWB1_49_7]
MHIYCWDEVHEETETRYVPKEFELLLEASGANNLAKAKMIAAWQDNSEYYGKDGINTQITSCEVEDGVIKAVGFFKLNNTDCRVLIYWSDNTISTETLINRDAAKWTTLKSS